MAKTETVLYGDFDEILKRITDGILDGSVSASLEDMSDFHTPQGRCSVRVFERFSYSGQNRLSLSVTLFQTDDQIWISAISSGGSNGVFFKFNTLGENAFLAKLQDILDSIK